MAARDRIDHGELSKQAAYAVRREFGNVALVQNVTRDQWGWIWLEDFLQDVRYAARTLRKNPGFTAVAVLTLALGIGANTAIFSVVSGVLLNPLPFPEPDRLVTVDASKPNFPHGSISYPNFLDWHRMNQSFSFFAVSRTTGYSLTGIGNAEELNATVVTSDFFPMLGVKPVLGRWFTPAEDEIGGSNVVAISTALWERKFRSSLDVIGRIVQLDGRGYTIVGVFPGHFDLPMPYFNSVDIYAPLGEFPNPLLGNRLAGLGIHGIARLRTGVTIEQARADLERVTRFLAQTYPDADKGTGATLVPLKERLVGRVRSFLCILLGAVGLVLLIACVNVANLLLARSTARAHEFAIRSALGAGRGRLVRQLLTESVLLGLAGGGLGLLLAQFGTHAALGLLPVTLPRAQGIRIDTQVLLFTLAISILAGMLFGLAPAFKTSQPRLQQTLKEGGRGFSSVRHKAQGLFVVSEMAMALVLLICAGLMIRSLAKLWNIDPGFNPDQVLTFNLALPPPMMKASPAAIRAALRTFDAAMAATPGVEAESLSWAAFPMGSEDDATFWIDGQPRPASNNEMNWSLKYIVGPDYLKAMRIALLAGRFFSPQDDERSRNVVVVDTVLSRTYFPNGDAIGHILHFADDPESYEIVGIAGHVKQWGLDSDDQNSLRAQMYLPLLQMADRTIALVPSNTSVVVRSSGSLAGLMDAIRRTNEQISKDEVISGAQTVHEIIAASLASRRFLMALLGVFAFLALVLSSVGIYGVISYLVGQRTQEIGLRVALGARRIDVLRLVMSDGASMAVIGVIIGLLVSLALTRLMIKMLYGVSPTDLLTFVGVAILLTLVALAACYIPARRATRVDPVVALRYE